MPRMWRMRECDVECEELCQGERKAKKALGFWQWKYLKRATIDRWGVIENISHLRHDRGRTCSAGRDGLATNNVKCISRSTHMQPKSRNPQSLWPALDFRASSQPSTDWWPATWLAVAFDSLWCYERSLSRLSGSSRRRSAVKLNNCSLLETQNLRKKNNTDANVICDSKEEGVW